jgi:signal transduction histidine kinase
MEGIVRILRRFVAATILLSLLLLVFNVILLGTVVFQKINRPPSPEHVLKEAAAGLTKAGDGYRFDSRAGELLEQKNVWAMLLDETGQVRWEYRLPGEVPRSFSLLEAAKFSRFYLADYPVYIWEHPDGLLVVGYPKSSYAKYRLDLPTDWLRALPWRLGLLLLLNVAVAVLISVGIGTRLFRKLRPLGAGIHKLAREEKVELDSKGLFGDLAVSINSASASLQQKTAALNARDEARSNWIAGISHDIRTPLSMVLGYASELEENEELPQEPRQQAGIIRRQGEKLRSLVNDLNLVSMLEYEMQPLHLKPVRLSVLARQAVADVLNSGLDARYQLEFRSSGDETAMQGDSKLLLRAIGNLIHNSIRHNPEGCLIVVETFPSRDGSGYRLRVTDNGRGIPLEKREGITELPYSAGRKGTVEQGHGLGLPMVDRIAKAHQGRLELEDAPGGSGLSATLVFPGAGAAGS